MLGLYYWLNSEREVKNVDPASLPGETGEMERFIVFMNEIC